MKRSFFSIQVQHLSVSSSVFLNPIPFQIVRYTSAWKKGAQKNKSYFFTALQILFLYFFHQCLRTFHFIKSVRIRSYSGPHFPAFGLSPYSVRLQENTDQNNSKYGHFLCSVHSFNFFRYILQVFV